MNRLRFFKFVLLSLTIAAFIYLIYILFLKTKAAADTILFMPIIIKSAVVTCAVAGTAAVLFVFGRICVAVYKLMTSPKVTNEQTDVNEQKVTLNDVIVSDELKEDLKVIFDGVSEKMKENFKTVGLTPAQGYLFYGPPGTGKTLLARAIAGEANINFFNISASELVGAYAGHGIEHVCNLFKIARKNAPCIIFIDEIDSIGAKRTSNSSSVSQDHNKTLIQLLNEMDGFDSNKGITVIAATNRPEVLDEALRRRFPEKINISLPDVISREKILRLQMGTAPAESGLSLEEVAKKTDGFSGADLEYLVNEVKRHAAERTEEETDTTKLVITMDDFTKALEKLKKESPEPKNEEANVKDVVNVLKLFPNLVIANEQNYC